MTNPIAVYSGNTLLCEGQSFNQIFQVLLDQAYPHGTLPDEKIKCGRFSINPDGSVSTGSHENITMFTREDVKALAQKLLDTDDITVSVNSHLYDRDSTND